MSSVESKQLGAAKGVPGAGNTTTIKSAVTVTAASLGFTLKKEQEVCIFQFASGKDVFVSLPTGYGKSLCYTILPALFDRLRSVEKKSIILVVSPLRALMKDQVAAITSMGIAATCISDKESTAYSTKKAVQEGCMQVILITPEALFCGTEWRRLLCTDVYRHNLVAFVVDEAHCIKEWYFFLYCLPYNLIHYMNLS